MKFSKVFWFLIGMVSFGCNLAVVFGGWVPSGDTVAAAAFLALGLAATTEAINGNP